eukprot:NODE_733_length_4713_cov_0.157781.p1 type:complete len:629 gc:universal NODE_733_length_4713_cov_0.157781:2376-4262(+)
MLSAVQIQATDKSTSRLIEKLCSMHCFHIKDQKISKYNDVLHELRNLKSNLLNLSTKSIPEYSEIDTRKLKRIRESIINLNSDLNHLYHRWQQLQIQIFIHSTMKIDANFSGMIAVVPSHRKHKLESLLFLYDMVPSWHPFHKDFIVLFNRSTPKVNKLLLSFNAKPICVKEIDLNIVIQQIDQVQTVILTKKQQLYDESNSDDLQKWLYSVNVDISYYELLSKCNIGDSHVIIQGWVPNSKLNALKNCLDDVPNVQISLITLSDAPTYINYVPNSFLSTFSKKCHSVMGVPNLHEIDINHVVTIIPIIFGLLIGDVGHGMLILVCSMFFISLNKMIAYPMIVLSLFAIYTGLVYNQYFGVALQLFRSPYDGNSSTYRFGLDYHYHDDFNLILYFKLKLAYIMTFFIILFGLLLKFINIQMEFKLMRFLNTCPQFLIYIACFGYPILLMILIWMQYDLTIYDCLFQMVFNPFSEKHRYPYQTGIEKSLVVCSLICLTWLFLVNPITLYFKQRIYNQQGYLPLFEIRLQTFETIMTKNLMEITLFIFGIWSGMQSFVRLFAFTIAHGAITEVLWKIREVSVIAWVLGTLPFLIAHVILAVGISIHGFIAFKNQFYKGNGVAFKAINKYS